MAGKDEFHLHVDDVTKVVFDGGVEVSLGWTEEIDHFDVLVLHSSIK